MPHVIRMNPSGRSEYSDETIFADTAFYGAKPTLEECINHAISWNTDGRFMSRCFVVSDEEFESYWKDKLRLPLAQEELLEPGQLPPAP